MLFNLKFLERNFLIKIKYKIYIFLYYSEYRIFIVKFVYCSVHLKKEVTRGRKHVGISGEYVRGANGRDLAFKSSWDESTSSMVVPAITRPSY